MRRSRVASTPGTNAAARPTARPMLFAALAGACGVFAFAPFGYWPLQLVSLAYLFYQVGLDTSVKRGALVGWAYGMGWSVAGIHWLYVAMHHFGGMPAILAALAVGVMGAYMGLYAGLATACATWLRRRWSLPLTGFVLLVLPVAWAVSEWLRGWIFTGFPWLSAGYAHNASPLAGFAPILGVYGLGALAALCAGALVLLTQRTRILAVAVVATTVSAGLALTLVSWTEAAGKPISVRLLQGDVAQDQKFDPAFIRAALTLYQDMITAAPADLIAAPETAIVLFPRQLPPDYLAGLASYAQRSGSALMLGIPMSDGPRQYANSVIGMAKGSDTLYRYDKHHLVPFGEFVPPGFRWFVDLMQIPLGDFGNGKAVQPAFAVKDQLVLPNVCYEDLFGEEIAAQLKGAAQPATILLNVSNLAWYGKSVAIPQHLQISQMRAIETGRPMLRATNNGATAHIDARGQVVAALASHTRGTLAATVQGMRGDTPYILFGNALFLALGALALAGAWLAGRKFRKNAAKLT